MKANRGRVVSEANFRRMWDNLTIPKAEIGRRLGITGAAVTLRAEARGFPPRPTVRPWQQVHSKGEMVRLFDLGLSLTHIAEVLGCTASTVRHALKKSGRQMRPIRKPAPVPRKDAAEVMLGALMASSAPQERAAVAEFWKDSA